MTTSDYARRTTRPGRWRWSPIASAPELTFKMMNAETQLMYASDYPHWDMDLPSTIYDLPFLNEAQKRQILGGNAKRVFSLDGAVSAQKAQRRAAASAPR